MKPQHTPEPWNCGGLDYCPECGATGDYGELKQQRDELLAAAEYALLELRNPARRDTEALALGISVLRGAIAKYRGQQ